VRRTTLLARRAREILREEGPFSAWCKLLALAGYRRVVLIARELDRPTADGGIDLSVTVRRLTGGDLPDYLAFRRDVDAEDVRRRLQAGDECFAAWVEGRIVHACWVSTGTARITFLGRALDLAPDEIYADESYTAPGFRGHNVAAQRSAAMARHYRAAGYRRSLAVVFPENRPAWRAAEKAGYRPLAVLGYVRLGPWRRDFRRPWPDA
jgi:GNAT superfamily N-acetyltransferase